MNLLAILVVSALGAGGPPGIAAREGAPVLRNATVYVSRRGRLVARSNDGRLRARLRAGVYTVSVALRDGVPAEPPHTCQTRTVRLMSGSRRAIDLFCPIK